MEETIRYSQNVYLNFHEFSLHWFDPLEANSGKLPKVKKHTWTSVRFAPLAILATGLKAVCSSDSGSNVLPAFKALRSVWQTADARRDPCLCLMGLIGLFLRVPVETHLFILNLNYCGWRSTSPSWNMLIPCWFHVDSMILFLLLLLLLSWTLLLQAIEKAMAEGGATVAHLAPLSLAMLPRL